MKHPGPAVSRERLSVLGKYLDDALRLANMSQSELARRAGLRSSSYISRIMKDEHPKIDRDVLLKWCRIMKCPDWLEAQILHAALYASEPERIESEKEETVEATHQAVLDEIERRKKD